MWKLEVSGADPSVHESRRDPTGGRNGPEGLHQSWLRAEEEHVHAPVIEGEAQRDQGESGAHRCEESAEGDELASLAERLDARIVRGRWVGRPQTKGAALL